LHSVADIDGNVLLISWVEARLQRKWPWDVSVVWSASRYAAKRHGTNAVK
jgi:hypothetical protein